MTIIEVQKLQRTLTCEMTLLTRESKSRDLKKKQARTIRNAKKPRNVCRNFEKHGRVVSNAKCEQLFLC